MLEPTFVSAMLLAGAPDRLELQLVTGERELMVEHGEAHGVPIRGAYEVWAIDAEGGQRQLAEQTSAAPRDPPDAARVEAERARELAAAALGCAPQQLAPELVYLRQLDATLLAWEVTGPLRFTPDPARERVWISAISGTVLARRSLVHDSGARVYPEDPASTPAPIEVVLDTHDVEVADVPLQSARIEVFGCADQADEPPPPWWAEGQCVPIARARSDAQGDYYVTLPDLAIIADTEAHDDAYAELAAYWFAEQFFERMAARGVDSHLCDTFNVSVNQYGFDEQGERDWLEGAYFVNTCDGQESPTLIFGQGRYVDFAWDADIVYHELAHSLVEHLTPEGLGARQYMSTGIVAEAAAINEGLADYFAVALNEDPELGEYVGRFSVSLGNPYLRTAQNEHECPRNLRGQAHNDGQVLLAALWASRQRVGEIVDELVLQTLPRVAGDASLEDFARALMVTTDEFVDAGVFGATERDLIARSLSARGLLDCLHVLDDQGLVSRGKRLQLLNPDGITPFAPGPLQLRYEVPAGESEVTIFFSMSATDAAATLLVRRGDQPVEFRYASVNEQLEVTGVWDLELEAESLNGQDFIARVAVEPGEILHVALANRSSGSASVSNFFVSASDPAPAEAGCGCTQGSSPGGGLAWLALCLLGLRRRRRIQRSRKTLPPTQRSAHGSA